MSISYGEGRNQVLLYLSLPRRRTTGREQRPEHHQAGLGSGGRGSLLSPHHAAGVSDARIVWIFGELFSPPAADPVLFRAISISHLSAGSCWVNAFYLGFNFIYGPFWWSATRGGSE